MNRYFLVDFENVSDDGLNGFKELSSEDTVIVMYTDKACKIRVEFVQALNEKKSRAAFRFMKVTSGNQALDMQLATFLGSMIPAEGSGTEYVIVSKDKGYNHIIQFWNEREPQIRIRLKKSIRDAIHENAEESEETPGPVTEKKPAEKKTAAKKTTEKKPAAGRKTVKKETVPEEKPVSNDTALKPEKAPEHQGQEQKTALKPQENGGKGQEKTRLNAAVQRILSDAKYDTAVIAFVASYAVKLYGTENAKRSTYTGIIRQYGQKEGLQIYNLIKKEL